MEKVTAIIIAHNEQKHIKKTISILNGYKKEGLIHEVIVVDDGSYDKTKYVSEQLGPKVVSHTKSLGKKKAFITGVEKAHELNTKYLLVFDADLINLPRETLKVMINQLKLGTHMVVPQQYERIARRDMESQKINPNDLKTHFLRVYKDAKSPSSTAQRAIRMDVLTPILKKNKKWMKLLLGDNEYLTGKKLSDIRKSDQRTYEIVQHESKKWGLETALNTLVNFKKQYWPAIPIYTDHAYRRNRLGISPDEISIAQAVAKYRILDYNEARTRLSKIKRNYLKTHKK
jgi:glycosyltransferase involved in cell wall biosynthesis